MCEKPIHPHFWGSRQKVNRVPKIFLFFVASCRWIVPYVEQRVIFDAPTRRSQWNEPFLTLPHDAPRGTSHFRRSHTTQPAEQALFDAPIRRSPRNEPFLTLLHDAAHGTNHFRRSHATQPAERVTFDARLKHFSRASKILPPGTRCSHRSDGPQRGKIRVLGHLLQFCPHPSPFPLAFPPPILDNPATA